LNSLTRRLLVGGGVSLFSILIMKAMAFVNFVIAARLLTPDDYGVLSIVLNLQNFAIVVASFGMPIVITKKISQWLSKDAGTAQAVGSALLLISVVSSLITGFSYLLLSGMIAGDLYGNPALVTVFRLSALFVIIAAANIVLAAFMQGCQLIVPLAKINALVAVIWQPISFLAISVIGLEGAIIAMILSNSLSVVLLLWTSSKVLPVSLSRAREYLRDRAEVRSVLIFTLPVFVTTVMISPAYWIGRTVLALQWDFYAVGQFQIAESLAQILLALSLAMSIPLLPLVSEQHALDPSRLGGITNRLLKLAVYIVMPLSVIALPFLGYIISFLYGPEYENAQSPAILMFAAYSFIAAGTVISTVMFGIGRVWDALGINLAWMVVFLFLVYLVVPDHGGYGLASAYAVSYGIYIVLLLAYFSRSFGVSVVAVGSFLLAFGAYIVTYELVLSGEEFLWRLSLASISAVLFVVLGYRLLLGPDERRTVKSVLAMVMRRGA